MYTSGDDSLEDLFLGGDSLWLNNALKSWCLVQRDVNSFWTSATSSEVSIHWPLHFAFTDHLSQSPSQPFPFASTAAIFAATPSTVSLHTTPSAQMLSDSYRPHSQFLPSTLKGLRGQHQTPVWAECDLPPDRTCADITDTMSDSESEDEDAEADVVLPILGASHESFEDSRDQASITSRSSLIRSFERTRENHRQQTNSERYGNISLVSSTASTEGAEFALQRPPETTAPELET